MKSKQTVTRLIIGIVVLVGIALIIVPKNTKQESNSQKSSTTKQKKIETRTVSLNSQGFEPATLTIKRGEAVVWMNNLKVKATVNSDNHPDNKLYPFLNLGVFEPNSSVQAYFEIAGTYTYHNHLNPKQKGTIIVEE